LLCASKAGLISSELYRLVFSNRSLRDKLLLSSLSVTHESEGLAIAFCAAMWGVAGAQAATVAACFSAVLAPLATCAAYSFSAVGWPKDVRHRDGGVYNGEWSQGQKDGFGVYR
jgi:hypothetical protein